jgi:hypothetical protein
MQHDWLKQTSHEQTRVERYHHRVVAGAELYAAMLPTHTPIALCDNDLGNPLDGDRADQQQIPDHLTITASAASRVRSRSRDPLPS